MSDCSTHNFDVRPIRGEIHWRGDMSPTSLSYARYVNGHERVAEWVEFDGVRYVPESENAELRAIINELGEFEDGDE